NLLRRADDQVLRESPLEGKADPDGLVRDAVRRHDDQQIDVTFGVRRPVGVGTEENDLLRMKALRNLTRKPPDRRQRDVRRLVAIWLDTGNRSGSLLGHEVIPTFR